MKSPRFSVPSPTKSVVRFRRLLSRKRFQEAKVESTRRQRPLLRTYFTPVSRPFRPIYVAFPFKHHLFPMNQMCCCDVNVGAQR